MENNTILITYKSEQIKKTGRYLNDLALFGISKSDHPTQISLLTK